VHKDVNVPGYFSKQKRLGNSDLNENIDLEGSLFNTVVHLRFPENMQKLLMAKMYNNFAKSALLHGDNWIENNMFINNCVVWISSEIGYLLEYRVKIECTLDVCYTPAHIRNNDSFWVESILTQEDC